MGKSTKPAAAFEDYYQVLHLHPEADAAMVDQAYWHMARLYNAAIPTDSSARPKLDQLNEAYAVLRSPKLRREYDRARDAMLGTAAPPLPEEQEQEPLPLSVMAKHKVKPRPEAKSERRRRLKLPPVQSIMTAVVILVLAALALVTGTHPALIAALLIIGLAFSTIPIIRKLPQMPALPAPALRLPTIRAPKLPDRQSDQSVSPDALRESTEKMRERWRVGTEGADSMKPVDVPPASPPQAPPADADSPEQP